MLESVISWQFAVIILCVVVVALGICLLVWMSQTPHKQSGRYVEPSVYTEQSRSTGSTTIYPAGANPSTRTTNADLRSSATPRTSQAENFILRKVKRLEDDLFATQTTLDEMSGRLKIVEQRIRDVTIRLENAPSRSYGAKQMGRSLEDDALRIYPVPSYKPPDPAFAEPSSHPTLESLWTGLNWDLKLSDLKVTADWKAIEDHIDREGGRLEDGLRSLYVLVVPFDDNTSEMKLLPYLRKSLDLYDRGFFDVEAASGRSSSKLLKAAAVRVRGGSMGLEPEVQRLKENQTNLGDVFELVEKGRCE
jgi:hypothetical protein